jgi:hypothetical protein
MWEEWVLDASCGYAGGMFTFCPIEGYSDIAEDYKLVVGMNYMSDRPPKWGKLVAIVHRDGQQAVEDFCETYAEQLEALKEVT